GVRRLPLRDVVPALVDHALTIADDGVLSLDPGGLHQGDGGQARCAGAGQDDFHVFQLLADDVAGVDQAGGRDDGGAVLVVVEDGNVQQVLQLGFDLKAFGGLDVLQVDAAPGVADVLDHGDELVRVRGLHLDVEA